MIRIEEYNLVPSFSKSILKKWFSKFGALFNTMLIGKLMEIKIKKKWKPIIKDKKR